MDITNHTIINQNGKPEFVLLPYEDYLELTKNNKPRIPIDGSTPHEVVKLEVMNGWSGIRAWREYLGLTQAEMANRLEIAQPTYARMEAPDAKPRKATRKRIAKALGIAIEQL